MSESSLNGKTAIVTGSGRGIGRKIAVEFAEHGANVVVTARSRDEIESTVNTIRESTQGAAICISGDICDPTHVDRLFDEAISEFGPLDILVNNAGATTSFDVKEDTMADYYDLVELNLHSAVNCALHAARAFDQCGEPTEVTGSAGNILNITSVHSQMAGQVTFPYNVAKAGMESMTRALAISLAPDDILVNSIAPGFIDTEGSGLVGTDTFQNSYIESGRIPQARAGKPEEIARVARFVVSPENTYMTGQTLVVDGGVTIAL